MNYIHTQNVVHRDLKLENILIDEYLNIKLADFGFAKYMNIDQLKSYKGTKTYMAPEIREESKVYDGRKADIFSAGVILFIMVFGHLPCIHAEKSDFYYSLLIEGKIDEYKQLLFKIPVSDAFEDLILKMLDYNPNNRPTF